MTISTDRRRLRLLKAILLSQIKTSIFKQEHFLITSFKIQIEISTKQFDIINTKSKTLKDFI